MKSVFVLGGGAWGTALALCAFRAGALPTIWSISLDEVETINNRHENVFRLPGIALDPSLCATIEPDDASKADLVILAPPAQFMRSTCETFKSVIKPNVPLIIASKGIERGSSLLMSEVVRDSFPKNPLLVLSGPSFASDVAKRLPTAVTLAGEDLSISQRISDFLSTKTFRLSPSADMIGAQVGGACKNIIAIACGIAEGHELGDNARSAIITQGLSEIAHLGCQMGAKFETFLGLSGVGDITLTSLSSQSRNKSFGFALGKGTSLDELMATKKTLTEGVHTVEGTKDLAQKHQVNMPITFAMYDLLHGGKSMETFIEDLFTLSSWEVL